MVTEKAVYTGNSQENALKNLNANHMKKKFHFIPIRNSFYRNFVGSI